MSAKTRLWVLITGVLCAFVVLYGVIAGLLPQLSAAATTRTLADTTALTVETQRAQLATLQQADEDAAALRSELEELEIAIPVTTDWPVFLRELAGIQSQSGATLSEFSVGQAILPTPATEDPAAADPAVEASTDAAAADASASDPAAGAAGSATGLVEIPITITVTGTPDQVAQFFRSLQTGERLVFAQSVDIDSTGETTTGTFLGSVFVVPN